MSRWKYWSKRLLKAIFVTKIVINKQTGSAWSFLQLSVPVCRGNFIPHFKIKAPIFCHPIFTEKYINPQVRINEMVNKHIVDYHPSLSQLTSMTHPLIFLWTLSVGFVSPESFLNLFLNLYVPPWLQENFKFMVLRLLANIFWCQKIDFV